MKTNEIAQSFKMCMPIVETVDGYLKQAEDSKDAEYIRMAQEDMKNEPLALPTNHIKFSYPYDRMQTIFLDTPCKTKRELLDAIHVQLTAYLQRKQYNAPHAVEDFVTETIKIIPFNDWYAIAYIELGS